MRTGGDLRRAARLSLLALGLSMLAVGCESDPCIVFVPGTDRECQIGDRFYDLHVPANFTAAAAQGAGAALVVDLHGRGGNKARQQSISGWRELSDEDGFVLITPNGINQEWNGQGCCADTDPRDDVAFLTGLVKSAIARNDIDPARVYASGISNGGSLAHRLACEAADVFAGVAPVAYPLNIEANGGCRPVGGVSVIHFHGTADNVVPYDTGRLGSLGAVESNLEWADISSCRSVFRRGVGGSRTMRSQSFCEIFQGCNDGATIALCTLEGGTHRLYENPDAVQIARQAWGFFED